MPITESVAKFELLTPKIFSTRFDVRGKPRGWARGALEVISTC